MARNEDIIINEDINICLCQRLHKYAGILLEKLANFKLNDTCLNAEVSLGNMIFEEKNVTNIYMHLRDTYCSVNKKQF